MEKAFRKTGIDIIGDAPWGIHICQFYQTKKDLIDILVPYFKAGLENNEFCMWITSEPLKVADAKAALKKVVKNLDHFIKKGQIEILDYSEWYTKSGKFDANNVLQGWVEKENQALKRGYDGLRLSGNTFWLEKKDWRDFTDYEEEINNVIGKYRMIAICTYSLGQCGASEVIDVVSNHQFALIRREGKWVIIGSSERKRTEEAVRESEERFRRLSEASFEGIVFHEEGKIIDANEAFATMFGYGLSEVIGKNALDFATPELREVALSHILDGSEEPYDGVATRKDGSTLLIEARGKNTPYKGRTIRLTAVRDITERKRAEKALRETQELLTSILDNAPMLIYVTLPDNRYRLVNRGWEEFVRLTREEAVGRLIEQVFSPKTACQFMEVNQQVIDMGIPVVSEEFVDRSDGPYYFHTVKFPLRDTTGKVTSVGGISFDITERKRAEVELRERKEFTENLIASMQDGFSVLDSHSVQIDVNPAFCQMTGFSREELIGVGTPHRYWPPEAYEEIEKGFQKTLRGDFGDVELTFMRKNGERFPVIVSPSWVKDKQGNVTSYFATVKDITDRKRAEEKLRESEERYRSLFDGVPIGLYRTSPDGRIMDANLALVQMLGYPDRESLQATKVVDTYVNPEDRQSWQVLIKQEGVVSNFVKQLRCYDGSKIWVEENTRAVYGPEGQVLFYEGSLQDITERKRTEEALKQSEEKYRTILENIEEGYFEVDIPGNFTFFNDSLCRVLGYSRDEMMGMNNRQYMDKENAQKIYQAFNQVYTTGEPYRSFDWEIVRKDGTKKFVESSVSLIRDSKGERIGFRGIVRDITERKRAEEALHQSEERYRTVGETIPYGVWVTDPIGYCTYVSDSFLELVGMTMEQVQQFGWLHLLPPEDVEPTKEHWLHCVQTGEHFEREHRFRTKDGSYRHVLAIGRPVRGEQSQITSWVGINLDISARKQAEKERERLLAELEAKNRELESFVYTISHDLKAPLVSLNGFSGALQKEYESQLGEEGRHYLERIQGNVAHMEALIKSLLELSRIGQVVGAIEEIDVGPLLGEIRHALAVRLKEAGAEFVVQEPLPTVCADRGRIYQVFVNLIDNAVKFRSAERALRIEVGCQQESGFFRFHVADNGIGIAPEYHEQIFTPFRKIHPEIEGVGIGLALVKKIVEHHGGRVWVESELGKGSTFYFTIPRADNRV